MKVGDIVQHHFKGRYPAQSVGDKFTVGIVVEEQHHNRNIKSAALVHFGKMDSSHYNDEYWVEISELTIIGESNETN